MVLVPVRVVHVDVFGSVRLFPKMWALVLSEFGSDHISNIIKNDKATAYKFSTT